MIICNGTDLDFELVSENDPAGLLVPFGNSYLARKQKSRIRCRYCPFSTDCPDEVQNHMLTHSFEQETYQCDVCRKFFGRSTDLLTHFKTAHN